MEEEHRLFKEEMNQLIFSNSRQDFKLEKIPKQVFL
jgi:hypothetical protein